MKENTKMSKTKEELNKLKEEVETVNEKLQELTEEELEMVNGGGVHVQVKGEVIAKLNTTEALQGRVAGVKITPRAGQLCAAEGARLK